VTIDLCYDPVTLPLSWTVGLKPIIVIHEFLHTIGWAKIRPPARRSPHRSHSVAADEVVERAVTCLEGRLVVDSLGSHDGEARL